MWPLIHLSIESPRFLAFDFALPTYLVTISLTYCLCIGFAYIRAVKLDRPVTMALDICLAIMVGGFFGARLLHVFYEDPSYYFSNPLEIFKVWRGGFVFYGGLFGAWLASWILIRKRGELFGPWADFFAPVLSVGYALGRIACFLNGCCYGKFCEYPWAVDFHRPGMPIGPRHPTQLYASGFEFLVFALLLFLEPKYRRLSAQGSKWARPAHFFTLWLALHSIGRLIMEHFRDDDRGPLIAGLSLATWISLLLPGLFFGGRCVIERMQPITRRPPKNRPGGS